MGRRFTLLDDAYFNALHAVAEALEGAGLPFCLVGGGASQVWIASLRTDDGARRMSDAPALPTALRKTRDLDFSTRADPAEMLRILNELVAARGAGNHVLGPRLARLGAVSIAFTVEPGDLSGLESSYDEFLERRHRVHLRRGSRVEEIWVISLEDLLVTKLTRRGDKAKDIADVVQLLEAARDAGAALDLSLIRRGLTDRPDAATLLRDIERELGPGGDGSA